MNWQTKVPIWVLQLASNLVIPEDATFETGIKYALLESSVDQQVFTNQTGQGFYPGLIPNYSVVPEFETTTEGINTSFQFRKAVGFYGIQVEVVGYDTKKINQWNFPLDRKQFGFLSLSKQDFVVLSEPISYAKQLFISDPILSVLSGYNDTFGITKLFNKANEVSLDAVSFYVNPTVQLAVSFLPIWEVWAVKFFQQSAVPE